MAETAQFDTPTIQSSDKTYNITVSKVLFYIILLALTLLIIYVIYNTINPTIPIQYLKSFFHIKGDVDIGNDATLVKPYTATIEVDGKPPIMFTQNLYYYTKDTNQTNKLIIDLPGGAFINSSNTLKTYMNMKELDVDAISIQYPVLPQGTALRAIAFIESAISSIIEEYKTKWNVEYFELYLATASAGSYYGAKIINNGKFDKFIKKFSSVSGYFGYKTIDNLVTAIGDKIYLRRFQTNSVLDCKPLQEGIIDTFYAIAESDILKTSTLTFLQLTNQDLEVHRYFGNGHCFYTHFNSLDTQKFYEDFVAFIKN